ncbi:helix-turn-helix DNA binding domain protein [Microbacterium phage Gretchen]|uniref:Helix-turn-helix DNA-binding domain protein n=1 Tax=Microbacterium phage Percival TaxID=2201439 RepID=A0A2Z4Q7A2_9CAUD|nr:helix-turn-helix DNA-binding domain protein [Microbacterium phage Percival]UDL14842.1 helix-turn-helix DNA binding domain protein [Microbacterium phage Gretchen]
MLHMTDATPAITDAIAELEASAETVTRLVAALEKARSVQRAAISKAAAAGLPETRIAQHAGVTRMTVRAALGK